MSRCSIPLLIEIVECLLHGLPYAFSKDSRVEGEEPPVECENHRLFIHWHLLWKKGVLIAVGNAQKTGHLVDQSAGPHNGNENQEYAAE